MVDLPGHGLSSRPDAPYTLDWYAETMLRWLDALGIGKAHVVGHSYGGGVAQWMVLRQRERIDRLALVAPGGLGREVHFGLRLSAFPFLGRWLTQPLMYLGTHLLMRLGTVAREGLDTREIELHARMNAQPGTGRAFHRTVSSCMGLFGQRVQAWDRVHEVESIPPLALFWGERDRILPIAQAHRARERIEGTAFFGYPGVGHFVQLEASERFADELLGFLDSGARPGVPRLVERGAPAGLKSTRP
jgi:pimeloyl-ACP methyl ester carboxylesterase